MMVLSQIDDSLYEEVQVQIGYCKLFPLIVKDFVTRLDASKMMESSNLPFTSKVITNPGQAVQVAVPAGTGSTASAGTGSGAGTVKPIYDGSYEIPQDKVLAKQKEAIKNAGGQTTKAILDTALGS